MVSAKREASFAVVEQFVPAAPGLTAAGPVVTMPVQPVPLAPHSPECKWLGSAACPWDHARSCSRCSPLELASRGELTLNTEVH